MAQDGELTLVEWGVLISLPPGAIWYPRRIYTHVEEVVLTSPPGEVSYNATPGPSESQMVLTSPPGEVSYNAEKR